MERVRARDPDDRMIAPDAADALAPLSPDEVRIVSLQLDDAWADTNLEALLDAEELARADRFATAELRGRFVARHGAMRRILEGLTQIPAGQLQIEAGPHGKPFLAGVQTAVNFSLSHSGPVAVLAVASERRVGVDIERIRPMPDARALVERFFAIEERAEFEELPEQRHQSAFFAAWTRKEAFAKATGLGIAAMLDSAAVTVDDRLPPRVLTVGPGGGDPSNWRVRDVPTGGSFAAAVVAEGQDWTLKLSRWPRNIP